MKVYTEADLPRNMLRDATIAVLGFGNQGHAHAQNLRDSGARVVVGAREGGAGWNAAARAGFEPRDVRAAVSAADAVAVLVPDEAQVALFKDAIAPALKPGAALVFAHGFAVAFGGLTLPAGHDVILVAPKGQGHALRRAHVEGRALTSLVAIAQDATGHAHAKMLSYASLIGCLKAGAIETTFREEAVTDMFGEQAVLCGGVPDLVKAAFDTLVSRGYSPEVAYIECLHELKIITDLMVADGIGGMRKRISRTAAWGSYQSGPRIVTDDTRRALSAVLDEIESGRFASRWLDEAAGGQTRLAGCMRDEAAHEIERAGTAVRKLMGSHADLNEE